MPCGLSFYAASEIKKKKSKGQESKWNSSIHSPCLSRASARTGNRETKISVAYFCRFLRIFLRLFRVIASLCWPPSD